MNCSSIDFFLIFSSGFLGSFHCIGMCSPICMMLKKGEAKENITLLLYNTGRIFTYLFLGFIAGWMGHGFMSFFSDLKFLPNLISIVFGVIMIVIAFEMIFRSGVTGIAFLQPLFDFITDFISHSAKNGTITAALMIGLFNGFLPCPLIYAFLMKSASTLDPLQGIEVMAALGLGTFPAMFLSGKLVFKKGKVWLRSGLTRLAGLIICYIGIVSVLRGLDIMSHTMHGNSHHMHF